MSTYQKRTTQLLETVEACIPLALQGDNDASGTTFGAMVLAVRALVNHIKYPERKRNGGLAALEVWQIIASSSENGPSSDKATTLLSENHTLALDMSEEIYEACFEGPLNKAHMKEMDDVLEGLKRIKRGLEAKEEKLSSAKKRLEVEEEKLSSAKKRKVDVEEVKEEDLSLSKKRKVNVEKVKAFKVTCKTTSVLTILLSMVVQFGGRAEVTTCSPPCVRVTNLTRELRALLIDPTNALWKNATNVEIADEITDDGVLNITVS